MTAAVKVRVHLDSISSMQYTVWTHGRLIGETDLGFARCFELTRMGWFHPNELGERLMPIICGVKPAFFALSDLTDRLIPNPYRSARRTWDLETVLKTSTEYADLAAAEAQENGLALELRGPSGAVISTEDIGIQDTEFLRSIPVRDHVSLYDIEAGMGDEPEIDEEMQAELDEFIAAFNEREPWEGEDDDDESSGEGDDEEQPPSLPRYQILVRLIDAMTVP
jgi:hypothetical protein